MRETHVTVPCQIMIEQSFRERSERRRCEEPVAEVNAAETGPRRAGERNPRLAGKIRPAPSTELHRRQRSAPRRRHRGPRLALAVWESAWLPGSPVAGCNTFLRASRRHRSTPRRRQRTAPHWPATQVHPPTCLVRPRP